LKIAKFIAWRNIINNR